MNLPTKITPCPIIEAVIELKFSHKQPAEAIFGIIYGRLKSDFPNLQKLPILQLPEAIRIADPQLRHKPYYALKNKSYVLQVGPDVISLSSVDEYVGWQAFRAKTLGVLSTVQDLDIVKKPIRLSARYINFFEMDIFQKMQLQILLGSNQFQAEKKTLRFELRKGDFLTTLQTANKVRAKNQSKQGSVIDIDVSCEPKDDFFPRMEILLEEIHEAEKEVFFGLLTPDFLKELNPEY